MSALTGSLLILSSAQVHSQCPSSCTGTSTFFGDEAGQNSAGTNNNSFFGHKTGRNNTSGNNSMFGTRAGLNTTTGSQNCYFGGESAQQNVTGSFNSYFGYETGRSSKGSFNSLFGKSSGRSLTSGGNNTFIGANAGFAITTGGSNVCIGHGSGPASATLSSRLYIDLSQTDSPLIYGEFNNDLIRIHGELHTTGNLGVGTLTPSSKIHVNSPVNQNPLRADLNGVMKFHVSTTGGVSVGTPSEPPTDGLAVEGRVGIGTTTPLHKLEVIGDMAVTGTMSQPSDMRLKKNIQDIADALKIISDLQPRTYEHKDDMKVQYDLASDLQFGFVAQEVREVIPQIVNENTLVGSAGERYMGLNYQQLIPILTQAIKELSSENREMKKAYGKINDRLVALEQLLD